MVQAVVRYALRLGMMCIYEVDRLVPVDGIDVRAEMDRLTTARPREFAQFELSGVVAVGNTCVTWNEFMDQFIGLIESKGWAYGGGISALDNNGDRVNYDSKEDQA